MPNFVPVTEADLAPLPAGFSQVSEADLAPEQKTPGKLESIGRGALQGVTLGFSDELTGALESLLGPKTYKQARDEARANNAAASSAHPFLYGAGEIGGGIASAAVPGAVLGKGAALAGEGSALASGLGAASKVANLATGIAPEGAGLANVAARSALAGGVAGLGSSDADSLSGMAKDVGTGAAVGGVVGGALHGIGSKLSSRAETQFERDLNADIFKKARPKDYNTARAVQEANPGAFKELAYSEDFAKVQKLARSGKTAEAAAAADTFVDKAGANRLSNYAEVEKHYTTTPGEIVDRMRKLAAYKSAGNSPEESRAISDAASGIRDRFSTIDRGLIKEGDTVAADELAKLKSFLPDRPTLTKTEFQDAAVKASGGKNYGDVSNEMHQAIESLPFTFDPNAHVSLVDVRKAATQAQNATKATLGSIAETEHFRIVKGVDDAINDALNAHLDKAAQVNPQAAKAVERIRHDNKIISMGLSIRDALEQRASKEALGKGETTADRTMGAITKLSHIGAFAEAVSAHNPVAAGALAVAPYALKGAGVAARRGSDTLARFVYAAKQGNPYAIRMIKTLQATPAGAARIAALMSGGSQ